VFHGIKRHIHTNMRCYVFEMYETISPCDAEIYVVCFYACFYGIMCMIVLCFIFAMFNRFITLLQLLVTIAVGPLLQRPLHGRQSTTSAAEHADRHQVPVPRPAPNRHCRVSTRRLPFAALRFQLRDVNRRVRPTVRQPNATYSRLTRSAQDADSTCWT